MLFRKVCIIGFGLIGSSLARILVRDGLAGEIVCADANPDVCRRVMELGIAHFATTNLCEGVMDSDLVILSIPVGAYASVMREIAPALMPDAVVTDVGSVKKTVIDAIRPYLPAHAHFVPAHPIAGTEFSGPDAGFAELFEKRWCILTPMPETELRAVEKVVKLWEAGGAMIEIMDARRHDLVLGITSHLPHLIAYTIVGTAADLEEDTKADVIKFSASGFRDFTRIASSDPVMWRDIFLNNREAVLEILQRFTEDLTAMQKAVRTCDGRKLESVFTRTRAIRKAVIQTGQAENRGPTVPEAPLSTSAARAKASGSAK